MLDRKKQEENLSGARSPARTDSNEPGLASAANDNSGDPNDEGADGGEEVEIDSSERKLYKSPRFTGYLIIFLSSIINYHGLLVSEGDPDEGEVHVIASTLVQRQYGYVAAIVSCMASGFCLVCHLDIYSCLANTWQNNLFAPKSKFETILCVFLLSWWFTVVIIQTRALGIAGDGKGQHNIFFSTWCCFLCAISIVESKMMEHDWPSIKSFIKSWPHRAPGWIAILVSDFFLLWWYVDIYITYYSFSTKEDPNPMLASYYASISDKQTEILIFVAAATLLPSGAFVFMEIFRVSSDNKKGPVETYVEAIFLLLLACAWIPVVCVATTPGGIAAVRAIK